MVIVTPAKGYDSASGNEINEKLMGNTEFASLIDGLCPLAWCTPE